MTTTTATSDLESRWGGLRAPIAADLAAGLLLLVFGVLKAYALAPALSDENIYFYMCSRIAEGALPYRDFFFAHPPFHLIPGALLMAIGGFSLPLAKTISAFAAAMAGVAVYRAARRCGPIAALLALVLFLFSYDLLRASSHYTGANEATALLAWSLERALANRPRIAGLLAASAALTALYAIPAGAALFVCQAVWKGPTSPRPDMGKKQSRAAVEYALAFTTLFVGVNLLCLALFRADYWEPVFRYHSMKPAGSVGNLAPTLRGLARENPWLIWSAPAALATLVWLRPREGSLAPADPFPHEPISAALLAGLLTTTLQLACFSFLTRVYPFYAITAFPALALAGGISYTAALRAVVSRPIELLLSRTRSDAGGPQSAGSLPRASRRSFTRAMAGAATCAAMLIVPLLLPPLFPYQEIVAVKGVIVRRYAWHDAPLPGWMNAFVRSFLWSDERLEGARTLAVTRSLWAESRRFMAPEALAERVRLLTPDDGTVFGDSIAAPLVALLAGRRIALDHVDTNSLRYRSGLTPPAEAIAELETAPPAVIIAHSRWGISVVPEMRDWIKSRYVLAESFDDPIHGRYDLYLPRAP